MAHASARLTPLGRRLLVDRIGAGWSIKRAAQAAGISRQTGSKWWRRYRSEGGAGLRDRSSAVHRQRRAHSTEVVAELCALRRQRRVGPHVLAWQLDLPRSSIYAILRRHRLNRLDRLDPAPAVVRYERQRPGELVHLDIKKLGRIGPGGGHRALGHAAKDRHRGIGWDHVHVAIDDYTRLAYVEELADESPATTIAFLRRALDFYAGHGFGVERVLTDNGTAYRSKLFAAGLDELGIGHRWTRPYRPQTNGKAERFIRTMLAEWAYGCPFSDTAQRIADLPAWVDFYNRRRPHWSLSGQPPISRCPSTT
jgi:transposase InsO family protein